MAFGIATKNDNKKGDGDFYERIIEFIFSTIVNVIICIAFGISYLSLYYAYLTPIARLNIMYPRDVAYYINKLRKLGMVQSLEKKSAVSAGTAIKPLKDISIDIQVNGEYGEVTSAGLYTGEQLEIIKSFYKGAEKEGIFEDLKKEWQKPTHNIQFSQQDLPAYPTAEGYYKALCDKNDNYKEIKNLGQSWNCVSSEVKFSGCDGEDIPEGSMKIGWGGGDADEGGGAAWDKTKEAAAKVSAATAAARAAVSAKGANTAKQASNIGNKGTVGGFFSDITGFVSDTMTFYKVPENFGWNLKTGTLLLPILWLILWIVVFAVAIVVKFGLNIVKGAYNICFGCWGSSLWGAGSFNYFTHMILIYSTVYAGKFTNWYIRTIGTMPIFNFIFGVPAFMTAGLITTILSWIFMTINVVRDPWWRPGSYGGISKLFLWMISTSLVMGRVALLFLFNFVKINFLGALRPNGKDGLELRQNIFNSEWLRLPLRIIFILLTLNSGMLILDDNTFIGLVILGAAALGKDSWDLLNLWLHRTESN